MTIVDTHCHLHREEFDPDREEVLRRAREAGVSVLIDPATNLASNYAVVSEAQNYPDVYAAVGIHPHDAAELTGRALEELKTLASRPKVVAVGEIGLDYYRNLCPRSVQHKALRELFQLAGLLKLPVIIHCRGEGAGNASAGEGGAVFRDLFDLVRECLPLPARGLLHCFSGDLDSALEALELGFTLSFAGNLTFIKAGALRDVAREVPFDRVVLETDAPFLAPQAYRGKRNEPAYLTELVRTWADLRGLTMKDVAQETAVNTFQLFGIQQGVSTD